jgi:DNA repair protein RecN (Recombination protein N)
MLVELRIQDFAIIDELRLELSPGFTVFSGETGAGKSIIIDAVEMLLGAWGDSSVVRSGAEMALIEGTFRLDAGVGERVRHLVEAEGLLDDRDFVTLAREIRSEGRNVARLNGRTVTLSLLRQLGERLVDVHGQSQHLSLLRVGEHLELLDRYAHVSDLREAYVQAYRALAEVRNERQALERREREAAQRADMLSFQIQEIEAASLRPGEEEELLEERDRLANAEELAALAERAVVPLEEALEGRPSAIDLLGQAVDAIEDLSRLDRGMAGLEDQAQGLLEQASELARLLRDYHEQVEFNPQRLDEVEERLALIRSLQRKYAPDIPAVLAHAESARRELEEIEGAEARLGELEREEADLLDRLASVASDLSAARAEAGEQLASRIERELTELHMQGARFEVDHHWEEAPEGLQVDERRVAFRATGIDRIEFLVAPNPGEGCKPLTKIASGGETSRLMLGLKSVLSRADNIPTLIFDEIDQGIGGRVGAVVGHKLWRLAQDHQVLCVTHLPQLAAFGDQHVRVEKRVSTGRTRTHVELLDEESRRAELAQMLGGISETNLESAGELIRRAGAEKVSQPDRTRASSV